MSQCLLAGSNSYYQFVVRYSTEWALPRGVEYTLGQTGNSKTDLLCLSLLQHSLNEQHLKEFMPISGSSAGAKRGLCITPAWERNSFIPYFTQGKLLIAWCSDYQWDECSMAIGGHWADHGVLLHTDLLFCSSCSPGWPQTAATNHEAYC